MRTTLLSVTCLLAVGCSNPASAPAPAAPVPQPPAPAASATVPPAAVAPTPEPVGVPAQESLPPGLSPLTDEEAQEAEQNCAAMQTALVEAARKNRTSSRSAAEVTLEVLRNPPQIAGVNVPRCAELLRRDLQIYILRSAESEAMRNLKMIQQGLLDALRQEPSKLCPSASPTPADLASLAAGPAPVPEQQWEAFGWQCVRFNLGPIPTRFQYQLETDPQAQTYRISARGYPLRDAGPVELVLSGRIEQTSIHPDGPIMRMPSK